MEHGGRPPRNGVPPARPLWSPLDRLARREVEHRPGRLKLPDIGFDLTHSNTIGSADQTMYTVMQTKRP